MGVVIRQSIKGTIVTYIGAFIGFVNTIFITTKFLSPEVIGLNRMLIEAAVLLAGLSQLGVGGVGVRFFPYFKTADKTNKGFFYYLCLLPVIGILLFGAIYVLFNGPIEGYFSKESPLFTDYYFWVLPISSILVYITVFETYGNVLMRITFPRMMREIGLRVFIIISTLVYAFDYVNLNGFVLLITFSHALVALINLIYVLKLQPPKGGIDIKRDIPKPLLKDIFSYSIYNVFYVLAAQMAMRIDIFMVSAKMGLEYTAIFSIAYYMAAIIEMPSRSMLAISAPIIAEASKNNNISELSSQYKKIVLHLFMAALILSFFLCINIKNIYAIMPNGEYYMQGLAVVIFISMAKVVESITNAALQILNLSKYYRYTFVLLLILSFLTVISNQILIPIMGVGGAALATLITISIYTCVIVGFICIKMKISPFSYNLIKIIILVGLASGVSFLIPQIGNAIVDSILRTTLIGLGMLFCVYYMKISLEVNNVIENALLKIKSMLRH